MGHSRAYFKKYLLPNAEDWKQNPLCERRAMNAILSANQMADWFFHQLDSESKSSIKSKTVNDLRKFLVARCADYQTVRDVADVHKHFSLDRASSRIKTVDAISTTTTAYAEVGYIEDGYWEGPVKITVDLGGGQIKELDGVLHNVIGMWDDLLSEYGW